MYLKKSKKIVITWVIDPTKFNKLFLFDYNKLTVFY